MSLDADVVVLGAGLAGATAATLLVRSGATVVLIDRHREYPACFKAEKIEADQAELLRSFGMFEALKHSLSEIDDIVTVRRGEVSHRGDEQYGAPYHDIVNQVCSSMPPEVDVRLGRATQLITGESRQSVSLSDGTVVTGRLLVLASGPNSQLGEQIGIRRKMISENHSVSFGFSIARVDEKRFDFESVNYYSDDPADRVGYVTLFAFPGGEMRANLFTFWDPKAPAVKEMIQRPASELERLFPGLSSFIGPFRVTTKVATGVNHLYETVGHRQPGVVLIGDSYQGACPSTGTGLSKVLTDVSVLCNDCVPRWLATTDMGVEKIDEFYDSDVKRASDRFALEAAFHSRETALVSTRFNRLQQTRAWANAVRLVKRSRVLEPLATTLYNRVLSVRARMRGEVGQGGR